MNTFFEKGRGFISSLGLWWPIVLVPIWQEVLFRYLPFKFIYLPLGRFWEVGVVINVIFAAIHWYMGKWFMVWSFFWGMVLWWVMRKYGIVPAIVIHSLINILDLQFGIRELLQKLP